MEKLKAMGKQIKRFNQQKDNVLLPYIRELVNQCGSYGYRRITILHNDKLSLEGKNRVNHKRISNHKI